MPPELNASCYEGPIYEFESQDKDGKPRSRINCKLSVKTETSEEIAVVCTEPGAGTEDDPSVNPDHTLCVLDFEVPLKCLPASCHLRLENLSSESDLNVTADLMHCASTIKNMPPASKATLLPIAQVGGDDAERPRAPMPTLKTEGAWKYTFPTKIPKGKRSQAASSPRVNLSGNCKLPMSPAATRTSTIGARKNFLKRRVDSVGRPFREKGAREHYARLQRWGSTAPDSSSPGNQSSTPVRGNTTLRI